MWRQASALPCFAVQLTRSWLCHCGQSCGELVFRSHFWSGCHLAIKWLTSGNYTTSSLRNIRVFDLILTFSLVILFIFKTLPFFLQVVLINCSSYNRFVSKPKQLNKCLFSHTVSEGQGLGMVRLCGSSAGSPTSWSQGSSQPENPFLSPPVCFLSVPCHFHKATHDMATCFVSQRPWCL